MKLIYLLKNKALSMKTSTKVIGTLLVVTVALTLMSMYFMHSSIRTALGSQLDQKTISVARDVASRSEELFLTNNIFELYQLAHNTMENHDDVAYVFFLDDEDNILIHTFDEYFPADLLTVEHDLNEKGYSIKKLQTEEGLLRDAAVPVFSGQPPEKIGRVGLIDYSLQNALAAATRRLIIVSVLTFITASIIVYFLINITFVNPLNSLINSVKAVAWGNFPQRVNVKAGYELNSLAESFNSMTEQLSQAQESRNHLMKKIIYSQEEERRRISRELHDETGQMLNTLMISLHFLEESAERNELKQKTEEFRRLLLQSLQQVRLLAWKLSPAPLIDLGLKVAIEELVNKYLEAVDWEVDLQLDELDRICLPQEVQVSIYRAVQEALTNISRHADAQKVGIYLVSRKNNLYITVEDNGLGFDLEELKRSNRINNSLGLMSMQERISLVGGRLDINSTPGAGTAINICTPLPGQDKNVSSNLGGEQNSRYYQSDGC